MFPCPLCSARRKTWKFWHVCAWLVVDHGVCLARPGCRQHRLLCLWGTACWGRAWGWRVWVGWRVGVWVGWEVGPPLAVTGGAEELHAGVLLPWLSPCGAVQTPDGLGQGDGDKWVSGAIGSAWRCEKQRLPDTSPASLQSFVCFTTAQHPCLCLTGGETEARGGEGAQQDLCCVAQHLGGGDGTKPAMSQALLLSGCLP